MYAVLHRIHKRDDKTRCRLDWNWMVFYGIDPIGLVVFVPTTYWRGFCQQRVLCNQNKNNAKKSTLTLHRCRQILCQTHTQNKAAAAATGTSDEKHNINSPCARGRAAGQTRVSAKHPHAGHAHESNNSKHKKQTAS